MSDHLSSASGRPVSMKRTIANERDYLNHTDKLIWFWQVDLQRQLVLRFPSQETFNCRSVYIYDRYCDNGLFPVEHSRHAVMVAVNDLYSNPVAESRLLKFPHGHGQNIPVVGGTYQVRAGKRCVAFVVRQDDIQSRY